MPGGIVATTREPNAAVTPMPISVHMLGLRLRIDCTQRSRNGQPAQSTTGTVSTSSIQVRASTDSHGRWWPNIASIITTNDSGSVHQKRSEEHTSELQSLMRLSYAVFCLKK